MKSAIDVIANVQSVVCLRVVIIHLSEIRRDQSLT